MPKARHVTASIAVKPEDSREKLRTLWQANLSIQGSKDHFLFRCADEFEQAADLAQKILDSSPSCKMVGARITGIDRIDHLWN